METDWAENRAKIPADFVRSTIGKLFDGLYSTPERDKFRTRLERNAQGETEIFISHRGVMEIYTTEAKDQTIWQSRPADPELEAEFLRRLMVKLGVGADNARTMLATSSTTKQLATVVSEKGRSAVRIEEGFDRAWRRVGLALDRTGFTVEDRDRKKGIYFVRYVASPNSANDAGFFTKLFSSSSKAGDAQKYQILVVSQGDVSTVTVQNEQGVGESTETANRILKIIADDVK
jgi:outer membrane protein assembly factor BamC